MGKKAPAKTITDQDYIDAKQSLIKHAERYANEKFGVRCRDGDTFAWSASWNNAFFSKTREMARELGFNAF